MGMQERPQLAHLQHLQVAQESQLPDCLVAKAQSTGVWVEVKVKKRKKEKKRFLTDFISFSYVKVASFTFGLYDL